MVPFKYFKRRVIAFQCSRARLSVYLLSLLIAKAILVSTLAEKSTKSILYFIFLFFLDTDPHLASVVCDLHLFSVSRYELCVCGNLCTCVRVSTNLESPPTMGNFKV
jgi:hypothetical protein